MPPPSTSAQWKLVPVEPTDEMVAAWPRFNKGAGHERDIYRAMLTSSPSPAASPASPSGDAVREALTFEALQAAYLRGAEWVTKIGRYTAVDLRKAAYDYADKMTPLASDATPAPTSGSEDGGVTDLWFTDSALPIVAISGVAENDKAIALHFRHTVTNEDRDQIIADLNAALAKPASEPAGGGES